MDSNDAYVNFLIVATIFHYFMHFNPFTRLAILLELVVQSWVGTNPGLKFNPFLHVRLIQNIRNQSYY